MPGARKLPFFERSVLLNLIVASALAAYFPISAIGMSGSQCASAFRTQGGGLSHLDTKRWSQRDFDWFYESLESRRELDAAISTSLKTSPLQLVREAPRTRSVGFSEYSLRQGGWLKLLAEAEILINSPLQWQIGNDKWIQAIAISKALGDQSTYRRWFPKTEGLFAFSVRNGLISPSGNRPASFTEFKKAVRKQFPEGLIYKANWVEYADPLTYLTNDLAIQEAYRVLSRLSYVPASGKVRRGDDELTLTNEQWILQGLLPGWSESRPHSNEYRVHTLEDQVVPGATFSRWRRDPFPKDVPHIEAQIQELLQTLPKPFLRGTLFAMDVLVDSHGVARVIELNPALKDHSLSGYLWNPIASRAFAKFLETHYKLRLPLSSWKSLEQILDCRSSQAR